MIRLLAVLLCLGMTSCFGQTPRPNVIIVLVDDMGYSDIGCYGSEIETPNIDKLAANGIRFTQFYNYGRCCPTRAALMTGLHPHQVGIGHMTEPPERTLGFEGPYQGHLNDQCTTLAAELKKSGYSTLMTGKWHLGYHQKSDWPLQRGFDRYFGCISGACNYFKPEGSRGISDGNEPFEVGDDFYTTDAFTDKGIQFIAEAKKASPDKPFFLYLAHNAPHWPLNAKYKDYKKYKGKYTAGWESLMRTRLAKQKKLGLFPDDIVPAKHVGPKWDSLTDEKRKRLDEIMAAYAGCIDAIDQSIGRLVASLDEMGELDNTAIFFLSDNGACQEGGRLGQGSEEWIHNPPAGTAGIRQGLAWANASNTPFRLYKHFVHEGGAATPMIAHWPKGIPANMRGKFARQYAYLPDFMPTLLELGGGKYSDGMPKMEGRSFAHVLAGKPEPVHTEPIYWEHEGNASMRWGDWKLVREYKKPWELFNISKDRTEMNNLAKSDVAQRDKMIGMWEAWAKKNQVAYPERFNMYQFLNKQKTQGQNRRKGKSAKSPKA